MESIFLAMQGAVSQGMLWSVMTLGVYITFKVLDYADLTVDGSFATGGAVTAVLIVNGHNPFISLIFATVAGMLAGMVTGLLHTKLRIPAILSGILSQLALYSINVGIMGQANISLLGEKTIFNTTAKAFGGKVSNNSIVLIIGIIFVVAIIAVMYWFFGTEIGSCIRATGNNEYMVRALGGSTDRMKILGLLISNGLVALSGALVAQQQGFGDVSMGIGAIVIALASVIIGEVVFGKNHSFWYTLASLVLGSIIYKIIIAVVLQLGLNTNNLKLLTAAIVALALSLPVITEAINGIKKRKYQEQE
ncbi:MAG: ABC transporter permease [Oscillospiraceae bacterium]